MDQVQPPPPIATTTAAALSTPPSVFVFPPTNHDSGSTKFSGSERGSASASGAWESSLSSSMYWIQQHNNNPKDDDDDDTNEQEYWKKLVYNALRSKSNGDSHCNYSCCGSGSRLDDDAKEDEEEADQLPSVISTTQRDDDEEEDDDDDESDDRNDVREFYHASAPALPSPSMLHNDDFDDSDDDDSEGRDIEVSIDIEEALIVPFVSLQTMISLSKSSSLVSSDVTTTAESTINRNNHNHNDENNCEDHSIVPSNIVFRTNNVVQTSRPVFVTSASVSSTTSTLLSLENPKHHPRATSSNMMTIPTYIYIQLGDDDQNHNEDRDNVDDDDNEFNLDIHDAIEVFTYDPTIHNLQNSESFFLSSSVTHVAQQMYTLLLQYYHYRYSGPFHQQPPDHKVDDIELIQNQIRQIIFQYPIICQIRFILPVPALSFSHNHIVDHDQKYPNHDSCRDEPMISSTSPITPTTTMKCYLLTYFVILNWFEGVQVAYDAYPEAIGLYNDFDDNILTNTVLGGCIPLHYACYYYNFYSYHHSTNDTKIIQFLLHCYPDAIRTKTIVISPRAESGCVPSASSKKDRTTTGRQRRQQQQLPIHIWCQYCHSPIHAASTIQLLLRYYPMSMQSHDCYGYTPLMYICRNPFISNIVEIVSLMINTTIRSTSIGFHHQKCSSTMLRSVTNNDDMEYILHIACTYHVNNPDLIQVFIDCDPMLCQYTNMKFQLPIHIAITSFCQYVLNVSTATTGTTTGATTTTTPVPTDDHVAIKIQRMLETIQLLIDTYPAAVQWRDDEHDETPGMIATRMLLQSYSGSSDKVVAEECHTHIRQTYYEQLQDILHSHL